MILGINGIISVSRGCGYADADVCAFITSANITDTTQKNAINQLVLDLKSANIWTKMKAIYPFVGGTAAQHRFNLKSPGTTNADFYLTFYGGGTHSANGYKPDGATAYADTFFRPFTHLTNVNSAHFAKYNRTNDLVGNKLDGVYEGSSNTAFQFNYSAGYTNLGNFSSGISYTSTDARGFFTTSRTSSTSIKAYRNAIQQGSTNTATNTTMPNKNVVLGARNDDDVAQYFYNTYEAAFFSLGDGLSDAEVANFYTAVQTFQTTLGRQV